MGRGSNIAAAAASGQLLFGPRQTRPRAIRPLSQASHERLIDDYVEGNWAGILVSLRSQYQRPDALNELAEPFVELTTAVLDETSLTYAYAIEALHNPDYQLVIGQELLERAHQPIPKFLADVHRADRSAVDDWFSQVAEASYRRLFTSGTLSVDQQHELADQLVDHLLEDTAMETLRWLQAKQALAEPMLERVRIRAKALLDIDVS